MNGKTTAVGVITSPELEGGIASLKIRYANTFQEANGVSFRVDIKQAEDVVKTYTITKANSDVAQNTVYTETISDINVAGTFQIIITNLSPTSSTSNKDRLSIGRLCWTHYADAPEYDETVREGVTNGTIGTMVYEHNITAIAGAVSHAYLGHVAWLVGLAIGLGAVIGAQIGVRVAAGMKSALLMKGTGVLVAITAIKFLMTALGL